MRVICAPDTLKGSLSALAAADALAEGFERSPGVFAERLPVADGGEGTVEVLQTALGGSVHRADVSDPLGRPIAARFLLLEGGGAAVIESAEAIGLTHLANHERNPAKTSSAGLGQLMLAALGQGATELIVTLGGSATVDGGEGLRDALPPGALDGVRIRVACDVQNPLLGSRGAAAAFGPQKGATSEQIPMLEERLAAMKELAAFADLEGAGAAGGLGAAFAALGGELTPGAELVLDAIGFRERLNGAALVVTGEGSVDHTTAEGKAPAAVARRSAGAGVPCVVFGGTVRVPPADLYSQGATALLRLSGRPAAAASDLKELGEGLGRLASVLAE